MGAESGGDKHQQKAPDQQCSALQLPASDPADRAWNHHTIESQRRALTYPLSPDIIDPINHAVSQAQQNGLTAATVEQEDFRIAGFAADVPSLRELLDTGPGFVILQNLPFRRYLDDNDACEVIAWGIANYFGRPVRQGISSDRRLFSVTDQGAANTDPTRIGASAKRSAMHTDNGCLEPRPPCYIALACIAAADSGGESRLITARTLFSTISRERPDLLPLYFDNYAFRSPQMHVWPSGKPYVHKPIFEISHGELRVHYARVMIEPGMELAGTPLTDQQREALDYFDSLLEREELCFQTLLQTGDMLITNNLVLLHGREAFTAAANGPSRHSRLLKRVWMRRRHIFAGDDPVALDLEEL